MYNIVKLLNATELYPSKWLRWYILCYVYLTIIFFKREKGPGTSLGVQWIRIRLPVQETQVRSLILKDPICYGTVKPVDHNY